jgi:hypothetical protein
MARDRRIVAFAVAAIAIGVPAIARAEFRWRAPAGCPDDVDVRARIARRLGRVALPDADVEVTRGDAGFAVTIERHVDSDPPRTLVSASCDELADAVAVIVARSESERARPRAIEDTPAVAAAAPPVVAPRVWHFGVRLAAAAGVAILPSVGIGGEVTAFVQRRELMVELGAARWIDQSAAVARGTIERVDVGLEVATARVGWRVATMPLRAWLVGELGAMPGTGVTMTGGRNETAPRWVAIGGGFGVGWRAARSLSVVLAAEALEAVERPSFRLSDGTTLYEPRQLSARGWAGVEVAW